MRMTDFRLVTCIYLVFFEIGPHNLTFPQPRPLDVAMQSTLPFL